MHDMVVAARPTNARTFSRRRQQRAPTETMSIEKSAKRARCTPEPAEIDAMRGFAALTYRMELDDFLRVVRAQRTRSNALGNEADGAMLVKAHTFLLEARQALLDTMQTLDAMFTECGYCGAQRDADSPNEFCPRCSVCSAPECTSPCDYHPGGAPQWQYTTCETCGHGYCRSHISACDGKDTSLCYECHQTSINDDICSCTDIEACAPTSE